MKLWTCPGTCLRTHQSSKWEWVTLAGYPVLWHLHPWRFLKLDKTPRNDLTLQSALPWGGWTNCPLEVLSSLIFLWCYDRFLSMQSCAIIHSGSWKGDGSSVLWITCPFTLVLYWCTARISVQNNTMGNYHDLSLMFSKYWVDIFGNIGKYCWNIN